MKPKPTSKARIKTIDGYLAALGHDQRAALERLRKAIKAAAPRAQECINYGVPSFRLDGKLLVSFGAWAKHCAFYPGTVVQACKDQLKEYEIDRGTVRFPADKPLPATLVRKLVLARIARNATR